MFIGANETIIDDKGRLQISKSWYSELASGFFVTRGFDQCLFVFPESRFESIMRDLEQQPLAVSDVRTFARHLSVFAERESFDKSGRIFIPPHLRQYAKVDGQVMVVGVIDRLEVWDLKIFSEVNAKAEVSVAQVAEKYSRLIHNVY